MRALTYCMSLDITRKIRDERSQMSISLDHSGMTSMRVNVTYNQSALVFIIPIKHNSLACYSRTFLRRIPTMNSMTQIKSWIPYLMTVTKIKFFQIHRIQATQIITKILVTKCLFSKTFKEFLCRKI